MSTIWNSHASRLVELINRNNETQANRYLEQLMLFPVEIQDKIIEEISHLTNCNANAISEIMSHYSSIDLK